MAKHFKNIEIISVLESAGLKITKGKNWRYFIEGEINGKKVSIGCCRLQSLVHKGQILPWYIPQ